MNKAPLIIAGSAVLTVALYMIFAEKESQKCQQSKEYYSANKNWCESRLKEFQQEEKSEEKTGSQQTVQDAIDFCTKGILKETVLRDGTRIICK